MGGRWTWTAHNYIAFPIAKQQRTLEEQDTEQWPSHEGNMANSIQGCTRSKNIFNQTG
jgi:hypothetical protein